MTSESLNYTVTPLFAHIQWYKEKKTNGGLFSFPCKVEMAEEQEYDIQWY